MILEQKLPTDIALVKDRHPFLVDFCKNKKRVLHIGCVDSGLLEERYNNGELLHIKLAQVCDELWGRDIDIEGINFLKKMGIGNLFAIDISDDKSISAIKDVEFDVIILSEVIEHLLNVGLLLESLKKIMSNTTQLVVTAPNAFSYTGLFYMIDNTEFVHPDHNYYFSYFTLKNILIKSRLKIVDNFVYAFDVFNSCDCIDYGLQLDSEKHAQSHPGFIGYLKRTYWLYLDCKKNNVGFVKYMFFYKILFKYLFSKSKFWGNGLIFVCVK